MKNIIYFILMVVTIFIIVIFLLVWDEKMSGNTKCGKESCDTHLNLLFLAIGEVESKGDSSAVNIKEGAFGKYQIRKIFVDDVNRICGINKFSHEDAFNDEKSEDMMLIYWNHYCKKGTCEERARIHNGGPNGFSKDSTKNYWKRVRRILWSL